MLIQSPTPEEFETIGQALLAVNQGNYNHRQLNAVNRFLESHAKQMMDDDFSRLFEDDKELLAAIKAIHNFANKYAKETSVMSELSMEIDEIKFHLNDNGGTIKI